MFIPVGVKICTKIFIEEIQGGEGCREKSTSHFIILFHTLSSEIQIQGNYFKEEVADEIPTLFWRADQETHMLQGEGRDVNKLLAAFCWSMA